MILYALLSIVSLYISIRTYILLNKRKRPNQYLYNKIKNRNFIFTKYGNSSVLFKKSENISNKLLLTIHGFGADLDGFNTIEDLAIKNDYNYLSIDLYGRGLSDSQQMNNSELFEDQITEIVNIYKYKYKLKEINVLAHSMGCIITNNIIKQNKINFKSIILLAPAGLGMKGYNIELFKKKYLGEFLVILFGDIYLLIHNLYCYNIKKHIPKKFLLYSYNHYGYLKSLLSTIRYMDKDNVDYRHIKNLLVIYSVDDRITIMNKKKFDLNCKFIQLKKYGHSELLENSIKYIFDYLN